MPLFLEAPLPGLLPQAPLQQLGQAHRPPGTRPPGGQALPLLGPTHSLEPEVSGPRTARDWVGIQVGSAVWLPAWLSGSVTHKSSCLPSSLAAPFSFHFPGTLTTPHPAPQLSLWVSLLPGLSISLSIPLCAPRSVLPLSPAVTAVPSSLAGHEVTAVGR